jgi:hypothetical protein
MGAGQVKTNKARDMGAPDMSQVDDLTVEFVCNGTRMRVNMDEKIVITQRLLGRKPTSEIARLTCTFVEEIGRIARATPGVTLCPYCRQRAYADDGMFRRHLDQHARGWCPQSGLHKSTRASSIEKMARS